MNARCRVKFYRNLADALLSNLRYFSPNSISAQRNYLLIPHTGF